MSSTTTMERHPMHNVSRVSKIDRLNARVSKLLTVAVHEVLELVRETVSEYQEKTARTQRENDRLRQRLRDALGRLESEREVRRAEQAAMLERTRLQEQQQHQQQLPSLDVLTGLSIEHLDPESPADTEEKLVVGEGQSDPSGVKDPEEEQKFTPEALTECAVRVQLMFTDHQTTPSSEEAVAADDGTVKLHAANGIKSDADDALSVSPVTMVTQLTSTTTCIPSPSKQTSSDIHTTTPQHIKTEPASPISQQEAPLSSFSNTDDLIRTRTLPATSRAVSAGTAAPFSLLVAPPSQQAPIPTPTHPQPSAQSMARRVGLCLGFARGPRFSGDARRLHQHRQVGVVGSLRGDNDPHTCGVCGKTFSRLGNLRIHERCHTGEKPYACGQCGRCFSQAGDLKKHRRVHTGEKPYYCGQCGKSFSRGENLRRHQKIHVGERARLQQASWVDLRPEPQS